MAGWALASARCLCMQSRRKSSSGTDRKFRDQGAQRSTLHHASYGTRPFSAEADFSKGRVFEAKKVQAETKVTRKPQEYTQRMICGPAAGCRFLSATILVVLQLNGGAAQVAKLVAGKPVTAAQAAAWWAGKVCTNSTYDPAKRNFLEALKGKHLRFGVYEDWIPPPYFFKDTTKTGNAMYTGYNVDMMNRMAQLLGVTYDVVEINRTFNGKKMSWTSALPGGTSQVDILGDFSTHTVERMSKNSLLTAHLDLSGRLVVRKPFVIMHTHSEKMFTFLQPFSASLWCLNIAL
jgi:hypothetical protein